MKQDPLQTRIDALYRGKGNANQVNFWKGSTNKAEGFAELSNRNLMQGSIELEQYDKFRVDASDAEKLKLHSYKSRCSPYIFAVNLSFRVEQRLWKLSHRK